MALRERVRGKIEHVMRRDTRTNYDKGLRQNNTYQQESETYDVLPREGDTNIPPRDKRIYGTKSIERHMNI